MITLARHVSGCQGKLSRQAFYLDYVRVNVLVKLKFPGCDVSRTAIFVICNDLICSYLRCGGARGQRTCERISNCA